MIILIECDLRLSVKVLCYFEDVITDFQRIILTANDMFYSYEYYIKAIVVEGKVLLEEYLYYCSFRYQSN